MMMSMRIFKPIGGNYKMEKNGTRKIIIQTYKQNLQIGNFNIQIANCTSHNGPTNK
jgi:hypothetical protein